MGRKPKVRLSFFKILINVDFTRSLRLPRVFVQKYREILPENAKLRNSCGETWDVKLEQMDDEHYEFSRGWSKFAKDMKLEWSEFLLFRLISGKPMFDVSVYGVGGCEKESLGRSVGFSSLMKAGLNNKHSIVENDQDTERNRPQFQIVLKPHHASRLSIRKRFAEAAALIGKKKVSVEYIPSGHRTNILLDLRTNKSRHGHFRLDLITGWSHFRKANSLGLGNTYSFEFIPTKNVIQVKPVIARKP